MSTSNKNVVAIAIETIYGHSKFSLNVALQLVFVFGWGLIISLLSWLFDGVNEQAISINWPNIISRIDELMVEMPIKWARRWRDCWQHILMRQSYRYYLVHIGLCFIRPHSLLNVRAFVRCIHIKRLHSGDKIAWWFLTSKLKMMSDECGEICSIDTHVTFFTRMTFSVWNANSLFRHVERRLTYFL